MLDNLLKFFEQKPEKICLCGSTKFKKEFIDVNAHLTMLGHIVTSVGFFSHEFDTLMNTVSKEDDILDKNAKYYLDALHMTKVMEADSIFVINKDGYIGESTSREIYLAMLLGKNLYFLEPKAGQDWMTNSNAPRTHLANRLLENARAKTPPAIQSGSTKTA